MKSKQEIQAEIIALRAIKPVGRFAAQTKERIALAIEELEFGVDQTAGEWNELSMGEQDIVHFAKLWKNGESHIKPSERLKN